MNENPILLARIIFFFHLFSTPKFSPLLPTTYQPLPPSFHRQSSRDVEWEQAWSWSWGSWSRSLELLELGAWSCWSRGAMAEAEAGHTWDPGKHLYFFSHLFVLFVLLCYVLMELRCNAA
jgi:hypothetical protein